MRYISLLLGLLMSVSMLVLLPADAGAQTSATYRIVTADGNEYIGTLVSESDEQVTLRTEELGEITIQRSNIRSMVEVDPARLKGGVYWFENPYATRYLFSTNAIGLKPGEGYYQNTWVFFNNINVGITDHVSLGGGLVPTFLFGTSSIPIWFIPKVSIPLAQNNFHLAAGGLFGGVVGEDNFGLGMAYGVATFGNRDQNLTFGMGYGYADGEWSDIPLFNLSGMLRLSRTMYLISENYFVSAGGETTSLISAAARWAPENFAVDFGLVRPVDESDIIGVPWLGVTLPFGR